MMRLNDTAIKENSTELYIIVSTGLGLFSPAKLGLLYVHLLQSNELPIRVPGLHLPQVYRAPVLPSSAHCLQT